MKAAIALFSICIALISCGEADRASVVVTSFSAAISDSNYQEAWALITPESRLWYDSTASILHEFGWIESEAAVTSLAGSMTEEEFLSLTGEDIFVRMVSISEDVHNLSTSIKSVSYPDSLVGVVVVRTDDGLQEIIVRNIGGEWLIDLISLTPPVEGG
ncbi:hypothetical protein DRQ25_07480 [Candidatus Fermentibacteria bacterium]|nr:MAG: hypothetical protein DRQ25_07480 [Candidatus Fermentibacteria bacterium]